MTTIVGVFDDFTAALNTTPDLVSAGFPKEDISVVAADHKGEYAKFLNTEANPDGSSNVGTGAVVGGLSGLLIGLAALAIPGIGPVIAAGPLAAAFTGAALGAVTGSFVGALNGLGVPEFEAKAYDQGVREGSTLVIVRAGENQVLRAIEIMRQHRAIRVDQHGGQTIRSPESRVQKRNPSQA
jgi:uncharacterized membrane protein